MKKIVLVWACCFVSSLAAEVVQFSESGFVSKHRLDIQGPPDKVWQALANNIARWWDATHSYSGEAANFHLDARAGGCFCETLVDGSVEHLRVVFVRKNHELRLSGGLGPLQSMGVAGAMTFKLTDSATGTTLDYSYVVNGAGGEPLAKAVDGVQLGQLERLKRFVETGNPAQGLD